MDRKAYQKYNYFSELNITKRKEKQKNEINKRINMNLWHKTYRIVKFKSYEIKYPNIIFKLQDTDTTKTITVKLDYSVTDIFIDSKETDFEYWIIGKLLYRDNIIIDNFMELYQSCLLGEVRNSIKQRRERWKTRN